MASRRITVLLALIGICIGASINSRPIVGILTQPTDGGMTALGSSYIAASYVKYVESAGGRVVPIFHNSTTAELDTVFNSVNAILFPGGGANLDDTPLFYAGQHLYNRMIEANNNGDFFPMFGHCMGFEFLAILTSGDVNVLDNCTAENITMALNFTKQAPNSSWLQNAPQDVINILSTQDVCMNNHVNGIWTSHYDSSSSLNEFYEVISTNVDIYGHEFVSTWEGKKYPVYAMQWHAEKNAFEWNPEEGINHSADGIYAMQYFSNFLVNQARLNFHKYDTYQDEYNSLIYNYKPFYTEALTGDFEQSYVF